MAVKTKIVLSRTGIALVVVGVILGTLGKLEIGDITEVAGWTSTVVGLILKIIREFMK